MVTKEQAQANLSANLRAVRDYNDMNVEELASFLSDIIDRNSVYLADRGERIPASHRLLAISERLGTSVELLLGDPEYFKIPRKKLAILA